MKNQYNYRNMLKQLEDKQFDVDKDLLWSELEKELKKYKKQKLIIFMFLLILVIASFVGIEFYNPNESTIIPIVETSSHEPEKNTSASIYKGNMQSGIIEIDSKYNSKKEEIKTKSSHDKLNESIVPYEQLVQNEVTLANAIIIPSHKKTSNTLYNSNKLDAKKNIDKKENFIPLTNQTIKVIGISTLALRIPKGAEGGEKTNLTLSMIQNAQPTKRRKRFNIGLYYGMTLAKYRGIDGLSDKSGLRTPLGHDFKYGLEFGVRIKDDYYFSTSISLGYAKATLITNTGDPNGRGNRSRSYFSPDLDLTLKVGKEFNIKQVKFFGALGVNYGQINHGDGETIISEVPIADFPRLGHSAYIQSHYKQLGLTSEFGKNFKILKQNLAISLSYSHFTKSVIREEVYRYTDIDTRELLGILNFNGSHGMLKVKYFFNL